MLMALRVGPPTNGRRGWLGHFGQHHRLPAQLCVFVAAGVLAACGAAPQLSPGQVAPSARQEGGPRGYLAQNGAQVVFMDWTEMGGNLVGTLTTVHVDAADQFAIDRSVVEAVADHSPSPGGQ